MLMSGPDPTTWIWGHTQLCAPSHELSRGPNCGDLLHQPVVNMNKLLLGGNVETLQRPIGKIPLCAFFLSCMSPAERNYLNGNFWGQDVYATSACWHHSPTTSYLVDHKVWPSTWLIPPQELGPKFSALITNENIPSPCPCVFSQLSRCLGWVQCMNLLTSLMLDRFLSEGCCVLVIGEEGSSICWAGRKVPNPGSSHLLPSLYHRLYAETSEGRRDVSPRDHGGGVGPRKVVFASSMPVCCLPDFLLPHSVTLWVITAWITYPG